MKEGEANVNRIILKSTITHKGGYLMNKKIKLLLSVLTIMAFSFTLTFSAFAADENLPTKIGIGIDTSIDDAGIMPTYVAVCPSAPSGKHYMDPKGTGAAYDVRNNNKLKFRGQAGQCRYCKLVLITQYNAFLPSTPYWGEYALWNPNYEVGTGVVMYTNEFGVSYNKNDEICKGFYFR